MRKNTLSRSNNCPTRPLKVDSIGTTGTRLVMPASPKLNAHRAARCGKSSSRQQGKLTGSDSAHIGRVPFWQGAVLAGCRCGPNASFLPHDCPKTHLFWSHRSHPCSRRCRFSLGATGQQLVDTPVSTALCQRCSGLVQLERHNRLERAIRGVGKSAHDGRRDPRCGRGFR